MNRLTPSAKILVVAVILTEMSVFAEATVLTLIALVLGGVMIAFGVLYSYRPGALTGLVVVAIGSAASIQLDSVLEVSTVLTAVLGLMLPLFLLAIHALGSDLADEKILSMKSVPMVLLFAFGVLCILSAPLFIGFAGLFLPTLSMQLPGAAQTAIILLFCTCIGILMTRRAPIRGTIDLESESFRQPSEQPPSPET